LKFAERLDSFWPRVSQMLAVKNSTTGHCRDYGPFSD
jgi:hypothetical protein